MKRTIILVAVLLTTCILSATIGGTVAWFTDEVQTGANQIKAGNLDIELYSGNEKVTDQTTNLFTYPTLWEPGAVAYANLSVKNEGDLALQYSMNLNTDDKNFVSVNGENGPSLLDVLKVAVLNEAITADAKRADVLAKAETANSTALNTFATKGSLDVAENATCTLVVYWPSNNPNEVDNQFNLNNGKTSSDGKPLYVNLFVNLEATQLMAEEDSFGPDYDVNAGVNLPAGVTEDAFGDNQVAVMNNGTANYYATMSDAMAAIHGQEAVIYCKPNTILAPGNPHLHVCNNLTIYGNGASLANDLEVDTYKKFNQDTCEGIKDDLTLNIYGLNNVAVWGQRNTDNAITINMSDCENVHRVYISGTQGSTNVNMKNCTYDGTNSTNGYYDTAVYTNNPGNINLTNVTIKKYTVGINQNNKSAGTQNIKLTNCTFIDCATESVLNDDTKTYAAPVRVVATKESTAVSNLTMRGCNFVYSAGNAPVDGNVLTLDKRKGETNNGTVNIEIDGVKYYVYNIANFNKALKAANNNSIDGEGRTTVVLLDADRNHFNGGQTCQFYIPESTVNINSDAESISIKNVNFVFEDNDTSNAFTVGELQTLAKKVSFENCTFTKVSVSPWETSTGANDCATATFTNCTWKNLSGRYGIHQNTAKNLTVTNCTFENCERGIHTNSTAPESVTITDNTFTGIGADYGMLCLAENGTYTNASLNIARNNAAGQVCLRSLNSTVPAGEIAKILTDNTYGTPYVAGSTYKPTT